MTKNITLSVDDEVLERVRVIAAREKTSVNGLVRDFLRTLADTNDRRAHARRRLAELSRESKAEMGQKTWKRDDLYDR